MKTKTVYQCDLCHKEFDNQVECNSHEEKAHYILDQIGEIEYLTNGLYPHHVTLLFKNGKSKTYYPQEDLE